MLCAACLIEGVPLRNTHLRETFVSAALCFDFQTRLSLSIQSAIVLMAGANFVLPVRMSTYGAPHSWQEFCTNLQDGVRAWRVGALTLWWRRQSSSRVALCRAGKAYGFVGLPSEKFSNRANHRQRAPRGEAGFTCASRLATPFPSDDNLLTVSQLRCQYRDGSNANLIAETVQKRLSGCPSRLLTRDGDKLPTSGINPVHFCMFLLALCPLPCSKH